MQLVQSSFHNEAARIVTEDTELCSLETILADLGWNSLQERRTKHKLVIFYKIINNLSPNFLQECTRDSEIQDIFALFMPIQICFISRFIPQR